MYRDFDTEGLAGKMLECFGAGADEIARDIGNEFNHQRRARRRGVLLWCAVAATSGLLGAGVALMMAPHDQAPRSRLPIPEPNPYTDAYERVSPHAVARAAHEAKERRQEPESVTVYATRTGTKYHQAGCQHLTKSQVPMALSTALERGLTPCGTCQP